MLESAIIKVENEQSQGRYLKIPLAITSFSPIPRHKPARLRFRLDSQLNDMIGEINICRVFRICKHDPWEKSYPADVFRLDGLSNPESVYYEVVWTLDGDVISGREDFEVYMGYHESVSDRGRIVTSRDLYGFEKVAGASFKGWMNSESRTMPYLGVFTDGGVLGEYGYQYLFGYWNSFEASLQDGQYISLGHPVYDLEEYRKDLGTRFCNIKVDARNKRIPGICISNQYGFYEGLNGFEFTRRFTGSDSVPWSGKGFWLSSLFEGSKPDLFFYDGMWWNTGDPLLDYDKQTIPDAYVVFYWSDEGKWLGIALDAKSYSGGIQPVVLWWRPDDRGDLYAHQTSFHWESSGTPFLTGTLGGIYLAGVGSREQGLWKTQSMYDELDNPLNMDVGVAVFTDDFSVVCGRDSCDVSCASASSVQPVADDSGKIHIENQYLQLSFDPDTLSIVSLRSDLTGSGNYGQDLLSGNNCCIYFSGGSSFQRSIDHHDADQCFLVPTLLDDTKVSVTEHLGIQVLEISFFGLVDFVSNERVFDVSLVVKLKPGAVLELNAEFVALKDMLLPYVGWHLDFPKGLWDEFYTADSAMIRLKNLDNYRMSYDVLQPCWRPAGEQITAYLRSDVRFEEDLKLITRVLDGVPGWRNVNLPNPLFDGQRGTSKLAVTVSRFEGWRKLPDGNTTWGRHNCAEFEFKENQQYKVSAQLCFEAASRERPEQDVVLVSIPHSPDIDRELNSYWREHCQGGVTGFSGIIAWWYSMTGKYNSRFSLDTFKNCVEKSLHTSSDGTTTDGRGVRMECGRIPVTDGVWTWNGGYIFDINAHVLLAAREYYLLSHDKAFLLDNFEYMKRALAFYENLDDGQGLLVLPESYTGLENQGKSSTYWDGWAIGCKYSLHQIYYLAATRVLKEFAWELGLFDDATGFQRKLDQISKRLREVYWEEDIVDNQGNQMPGGRFISWIDCEGKRIDVGFTDLNLMAIYLGITTTQETHKILEWLDSDSHAYAWKDRITDKPVGIITFNTIDGNKDKIYAGVFNPFGTAPGMENGQIQYWVAGFDWCVRAQAGQQDKTLQMMRNFATRHARGDLTGGDGLPSKRPLPMFIGTSQMGVDDVPCGSDPRLGEDGLVYILGLIEGIAGVSLGYDGLGIYPRIPFDLRDMQLSSLRYGQKLLDIHFEGWGTDVCDVEVDGVSTALPLSFGYLSSISKQRIPIVVRLCNRG